MVYENLESFELMRSSRTEKTPEEANEYWDVSTGEIGLYCKSEDPEELDLTVESGSVDSGKFTLEPPYESLTVKVGSELYIDGHLKIRKDVVVHGKLVLKSSAVLEIDEGVLMTLYPDSTLVLEEGAIIILHDGACMYVYGRINVSVDLAEFVLNNDGIVIDSIAVLEVDNIDLGEREYSLTEYEKDLHNQFINQYTQGEHNSGISKIGYSWKNGSLEKSSQVIDMGVLWGEAVLGDFKFRCLGTQRELVSGIQVVRNLKISKGAKLFVTDLFQGFDYLHPELYFGVVISNIDTPADCIVSGSLLANSPGATITFDRGATLHVSEGGVVDISNGGVLRCTHVDEDEPVLFIDGEIVVDTLEQLIIPSSANIVFGEKGRLIIRNKYPDEQVLFSTPDGIEESELYRVFRDKIDHVEYHVPNNCGIRIDKYFDFYPIEMLDWYAGRRFEQALKDGLLVWEGGFIELDNDIIPWANDECTLFDIAKLFKNSSSNDKDRLQEVVNHMVYCGSGDIVFRIPSDDHTKILTMRTGKPTIRIAANIPNSDRYRIGTDNTGQLFLRNEVPSSNTKMLISDKSKVFQLEEWTDIELG